MIFNVIGECIFRCCSKPASCNDNPEILDSYAPYKIFNLGFGKSVELMSFIKLLELNLGKESKKEFLTMQKGDVQNTHANTLALKEWIGYSPKISIEEGIRIFCNWYLKYYKVF